MDPCKATTTDEAWGRRLCRARFRRISLPVIRREPMAFDSSPCLLLQGYQQMRRIPVLVAMLRRSAKGAYYCRDRRDWIGRYSPRRIMGSPLLTTLAGWMPSLRGEIPTGPNVSQERQWAISASRIAARPPRIGWPQQPFEVCSLRLVLDVSRETIAEPVPPAMKAHSMYTDGKVWT